MAKRVTVVKTEKLIIRDRFEDGEIWTVEMDKSHNVIGEIVLFPASEPYSSEYVFKSFCDTFNRMELLEIAEALERIDNITKSDE